MFGRKEKANSVYWRDAKGTVYCPGDSCPKKKCPEDCPVSINTKALMCYQMGLEDEALKLYLEALKIAPDFYDPWNNMGAILGEYGQYEKAYDCYSHAHEILPEKTPPMYGMALTCRDMKRYDECLKWCDEYDKRNKDHGLDGVREQALKAKGGK